MTPSNPLLYEINTVPWLVSLTRESGARVTLGSVPQAEWDRIREAGFDYVWLMGVWQRSERGRKIARELASLHGDYDRARPGWKAGDIVGSPYSVQFYEPDVLVGGWDDLRAAREELARRGLGLVLDFVPNHTALDHEWATSHPEYYVQGKPEMAAETPDAYLEVVVRGESSFLARGRDPHFPPWVDTLQVNYASPAARSAMIETLRTVADHCDGVRCDMAMLMLSDIFAQTWQTNLSATSIASLQAPSSSEHQPEFWAQARQAVPKLLLMAEAYWGTESRLIELGFDYVYDKHLYDHLRDRNVAEVRRALAVDIETQRHFVRFLENHDEPRAAETFASHLAPALTLLLTAPGLRLVHQGQLEGRRVRIPVQLMIADHEEHNQGIEDLHRQLLGIAGHPCFHEGTFGMCQVVAHFDDPSEAAIVAYEWRYEGERRLCVINLSDQWAQCRVVLGAGLSDGDVDLTDLLDGASYSRSGRELMSEGLHCMLEAHQSHVFAIREDT